MSLKLNTIVGELARVRGEISEVEEELAPLKEKEAELRDALIVELRAKQMKTLNSELTGETYVRTERFKVEVQDEKKAWAWAEKIGAVKQSIDAGACLKALRTPDGPMPEDVGFAVISTESLTIRGNNQE